MCAQYIIPTCFMQGLREKTGREGEREREGDRDKGKKRDGEEIHKKASSATSLNDAGPY